MQLKNTWEKLNSIEKRGVYFILIACFVALMAAGYVANVRGWLESKVEVKTHLKTGLGLREGTNVLLSGVTVGEISRIQVLGFDQVVVEMKIRKSAARTIYQDGVAQVMRPVAIGEKQINIIPGAKSDAPIKDGDIIQGRDSRELVDMLSAGEFGNYLKTFDQLAQLLSRITDALAGETGEGDLARSIKEVYPTLKSVQSLSQNVEHLAPNIDQALKNVTIMSQEVTDLKRKVLGTSDMKTVLTTMADVTPKLKKMLDTMDEVLKELVITLKGMQESFLFKGGSRKARQEREKQQPDAE